MYMSPSCGYCIRAAKFFRARGVAWRNVDITASARGNSEFKALNGRGTPLIYIAGQRIAGFDQGRIDRALAAHGW